MKIAILFYMLLGSSVSFAQEQKNIQLLGRGFQNKNTKEVIALTCRDQDCLQLQFALFSPRGTVEYIGDVFEGKKAPTVELQEKVNQVLVEEFFVKHLTEKEVRKIDKSGVRSGGIVMLGLGAAGAVVIITGGVGALAISTAVLVGAGGIGIANIYQNRAIRGAVIKGGAFASVSDSEGWNWSVKPKKMNNALFDSIFERIMYGQRYGQLSPGGYNGDRVYRKIYRKFDRLMAQGVVW